MIELKTPGERAAMRRAGQVVARVLAAVRDRAEPGVRPRELDDLAAEVIREAGGTSSFLGYQPGWAPVPYPAVICASVNDAVVHGPPTCARLRAGDLLSVDCAVELDGWHGDAAVSFVVGPPSIAAADDLQLIAATERALAAGVAAAVAGAWIGDVSHAIGTVARASGYGQPADLGGHGIGRRMHEPPHLANDGRPGRGLTLRPGLVLAVEPMLLRGGPGTRTGPDGWTVLTAGGGRAAHAEHTVAITEDGPELLTVP
ncbi:MAG TPA: type I methionyl aminopeptidase [Pseudonocardia sp.]